MKNNETKETSNLNGTKLLKNISKFIIKFFIFVAILVVSIFVFGFISLNKNTNTGIDGVGYVLGIIMIVRLFLYVGIFLLPSFIAAICGLRYYSGKSKGKLTACWIWGTISLIVSLCITYVISIFFEGNFETQTLNGNNYLGYNIFRVSLLFIFSLPNLLYLIGCYKEQFKNNLMFKKSIKKIVFIVSIIAIMTLGLIGVIKVVENTSINKIMVSDVTLPTLSEFEHELRDRGLIYDVQIGKELTTLSSIVAEDNKYEYQRDLSFDKNANDRYPLFIYSGYSSLIEKSSKTAQYYTKGPEDWWISWDIFFVNGQIYAVIGEESELDSTWSTDLFRTRYGIIVSEDEKITTYNRNGNYFSYGGGIEHNFTGYVRYLSTKMVDKVNSNCAEIIKVDRVDDKTLDRIAKELSPRYWLEYKNKNN